MKIEFPCQQCGKPCELEVPDQANNIGAKGILASVQCAACGAHHAADVEFSNIPMGPPNVSARLATQEPSLADLIQQIGSRPVQPFGVQPVHGAAAHEPRHRILALRIGSGIALEVRSSVMDGGMRARIVTEGKAGPWVPSCPGCLVKTGGALQREAIRHDRAVTLRAELDGIKLKARHTVEPGQSLQAIARFHYGQSGEGEVQALYWANRDVLGADEQPFAGDEIRVPLREEDGAPASAEVPPGGVH